MGHSETTAEVDSSRVEKLKSAAHTLGVLEGKGDHLMELGEEKNGL